MRPQCPPVNRIITVAGCRAPPATARPVGSPPTGRAVFHLAVPRIFISRPMPCCGKVRYTKVTEAEGPQARRPTHRTAAEAASGFAILRWPPP